MKRILSCCVVWCVFGCASVTQPASVAAAREVLEVQRQVWNRGDIDGFMQGYWRSADLRFAGGDAFRNGWQETIDRYRRTYPDAAAMGRLDFDLVEVRELSADVVYVFGQWALQRAQDAPGQAPHGLSSRCWSSGRTGSGS